MKFILNSNDSEKKVMWIRILDPNPEFWLSFKKKEDANYYIKANANDEKAQLFMLFDIPQSDMREKGLQGIGFNRGVPSYFKSELSIGQRIDWNYYRSQDVVVKYDSIGSNFEESNEKKIDKFMAKYGQIALEFLQNEISKDIVKIRVIPKEKDFQLLFSLSKSAQSLIHTFFASVPKAYFFSESKVKKGEVYESRHIAKCIEDREKYAKILALHNLFDNEKYYDFENKEN